MLCPALNAYYELAGGDNLSKSAHIRLPHSFSRFYFPTGQASGFAFLQRKNMVASRTLHVGHESFRNGVS
jgi:hypothetical protein